MLLITRVSIVNPGESSGIGTVLTDRGKITAVGPDEVVGRPPEAEVIDGQGLTLVPGFIDLQLNGGFGFDFTSEPERIWSVARKLPRFGVTAFTPTILSSPAGTVVRAREALLHPPAGFAGAQPLGLHLEGPFLNPKKRGAHVRSHLRPPEPAHSLDWSPETGVSLVTLAPELPGSLALATGLAERGLVVGAGHSLATFEEATAAFEAGVRYGTHIFNAMPSLVHRRVGLAGALLVDERPVVGLIADGLHVHPALVDLVWRAAPGRLNLVSDAMAGLGMAPGRYRLGDQAVKVGPQGARLADGRLAGSILSLDRALNNLMAYTGCSLAEALPSVTTIPAALLGLAGRKGRIAPGYDADLALLDREGRVVRTVIAGREMKW